MGEIADDMIEQMIDDEMRQWHLAGDGDFDTWKEEEGALAKAKLWRGADGKETPYTALEKGHFLNILMFMRRKTMGEIQEETKDEDVAVDLSDAWANNKPPCWEGLMEEARNRGGMVAVAAHHIDNGMDEKLIRENAMT